MLPIHSILTILNAFVEDTCVVVVVAYLLTRGRRVFALLVGPSRTVAEAILLGLLLGAVGATEDVFAGARYPYVTETLVISFTAFTAGPLVAVVTAVVAFLADLMFQPLTSALGTPVIAVVCIGIGTLGRRWHVRGERRHGLLLTSLLVGMAAQIVAVAVRYETARMIHVRYDVERMLFSIPANGIGVLLLGLVVQEARLRQESERNRLEAEQARAEVVEARAAVAETQLAALRARLHPHFLFNALSSIAALCIVAPEQAEAAVVHLGDLMRRATEQDLHASIPLDEEIEDARAYLQIQQMRFGARLTVHYDLDPHALSRARVPPFSVLTLLENAVNHGIAPKMGKGNLFISVHSGTLPIHVNLTGERRPGILIAVRDDGLGIADPARARAALSEEPRVHGLQLLSAQLRLLYGARGRLRLFTKPDSGTLAVFLVPVAYVPGEVLFV